MEGGTGRQSRIDPGMNKFRPASLFLKVGLGIRQISQGDTEPVSLGHKVLRSGEGIDPPAKL